MIFAISGILAYLFLCGLKVNGYIINVSVLNLMVMGGFVAKLALLWQYHAWNYFKIRGMCSSNLCARRLLNFCKLDKKPLLEYGYPFWFIRLPLWWLVDWVYFYGLVLFVYILSTSSVRWSMLYENKMYGQHMRSWRCSVNLYLHVFLFLKAKGEIETADIFSYIYTTIFDILGNSL